MADHDPGRHRGPAHGAPYPVSRLAPTMELVDLAREIARADDLLSSRTGAELRVIADQIKALQAQARSVLERTARDRELHHARCAFRKIPGKTYHLYRQGDGRLCFSMLSPEDWGGRPPYRYEGAYRLETDLSWTPAERIEQDENSRELVRRLLEKGS